MVSVYNSKTKTSIKLGKIEIIGNYGQIIASQCGSLVLALNVKGKATLFSINSAFDVQSINLELTFFNSLYLGIYQTLRYYPSLFDQEKITVITFLVSLSTRM